MDSHLFGEMRRISDIDGSVNAVGLKKVSPFDCVLISCSIVYPQLAVAHAYFHKIIEGLKI
jgi:hypothetical protein